MPKPQKDETKKEFIGRCMNYPDMQKYPASQRYAICQSLWEEHKKESKEEK